MPARIARSIISGSCFGRRANDGRVPLATDLPLERRQLKIGDAVEREDHEVDVLLAKMIDRLATSPTDGIS